MILAPYQSSTVIDLFQRSVGIINRESASEDANWECIGHLSHIISITCRHPPLPTLTAISFPY